MSETQYLVLTKASDPSDVKAWGGAVGCVGLMIMPDGTVSVVSEWNAMPDHSCTIFVLNMTYHKIGVRLGKDDALLSRVVGESPRVWVHFGEINSAEMDLEKLVERWSRAEYDPLQRFTKHPMPYSQTSPTEFDRYVKALSGAIKDLLGDGGRRSAKLTDMAEVLSDLDSAWQMATTRFPAEGIERQAEAKHQLRAAQDLMPVFIYLDGLLYAHGLGASTDRDQKIKSMEEVIRTDLQGALAAVTPSLREAVPEAILKHIIALETGGGVLRDTAKSFCDEYKRFLKDALPESATTGGTQQETKP